MKIEIYTITGCKYCDQIKELMERAKLDYVSYLVGTDISKEKLIEKYPLAFGFPYVIINDEPVGGLIETARILIEKGLVSSKKNEQKKTE